MSLAFFRFVLPNKGMQSVWTGVCYVPLFLAFDDGDSNELSPCVDEPFTDWAISWNPKTFS